MEETDSIITKKKQGVRRKRKQTYETIATYAYPVTRGSMPWNNPNVVHINTRKTAGQLAAQMNRLEEYAKGATGTRKRGIRDMVGNVASRVMGSDSLYVQRGIGLAGNNALVRKYNPADRRKTMWVAQNANAAFRNAVKNANGAKG